ncbi:MAG TPA: phage tail protein [Acidimicrobiales bacterium]|nr:phage tail protein [Acidimicrobiales bacterium]
MSDTSIALNGEFPTEGSFLFEVDGVSIGTFAEVSGLEVHVAVTTYAEGGENGFVHQLPGRMTWPNIVLRRGVTDSDALFAWVNKTSGSGFASNSNKVSRSTGAITALGSNGSRLRTWELQGVMAVRWTGPRFNVASDQHLSEEIELAHHGFTAKSYKS